MGREQVAHSGSYAAIHHRNHIVLFCQIIERKRIFCKKSDIDDVPARFNYRFECLVAHETGHSIYYQVVAGYQLLQFLAVS